MCGIVAVVAPRGEVDRERLRSATLSLHHRGPDLHREWIADHGRVGLGHARLSIIDLTTGTQPIANEDERLRIVVNGEFYDFEAIRTGLEAGGHAFRTRSDSEIALHLYEDLGSACVHRLRGEYAFALWDEREGTLFAGRDRFGIKPLYYAVHDGAFILASEAKALAAYGVPLRWDAETLYDIHSVAHAPDRSLFDGIYQIPPGCFLLTNGEHVRVLPYWDFDFPTAEQLKSNGAGRDAVERLRHAFDEAVRLRLRADVPVACYLSGGIDSCAVLGTASKFSAQPIRAYTLSFDHSAYDERAVAEEQAALSGAEFYPIDVKSADLADHFADALYYAERPFINAHTVAKFMLSRAVRDSGIRVVLTGEGSDEIFAGYPHFRRDMVLYNAGSQDEESRRQLIAELDAANRVSQGLLLPDGHTDFAPDVRRILGFVPSTIELWAQMAAGMRNVLRSDFLERFRDRASLRMFFSHIDVERQMRGRDAVNQSLYVWAKTTLPNYILSNLGDRMEMAHSVEGRLPFLDHVVVEEVARMPVGMKIRGMTEKYVLREAARPVLTDAVYRRQKHPFLSPPSTLQREGSLYTLLQDTLRSSTLDGPGIYERRNIIAMLDAVDEMDEAGRTRADPLLTWLASICLMHERLGVTGIA